MSYFIEIKELKQKNEENRYSVKACKMFERKEEC